MEIPSRIEVSGGTAMRISWDGRPTRVVSATALRVACPCASCREPGGRARIERLVASDGEVRINGAELVGDYAVTLSFDDGHGTGIYPYELLEALSQADA